ncbi:MAG TPA: ATP-binding protein, partial [Dehalococcoidia bacterium]|nr:ATP-binding protein [Dehalococcoidia bacterium]
MTEIERFRVPTENLRRRQEPEEFHFECTEELTPLTELIGQDRALRSLQFGLGIDKPGYNVFVTGLTGTGKATAVLDYIKRTVDEQKEAGTARTPDDWCYVHNFDDPDRPNAIRLPAGKARLLQDHLQELLDLVRTNLSRAFSSDEYDRQRRSVLELGQHEAQEFMDTAQKEAEDAGFLLSFSPMGVSLVPMHGDKPMTSEEFAALPAEQRSAVQTRQQAVTNRVSEVGRRLRVIEREVGIRLRELDRRVAEAVMSGPFEAIMEEFEGQREVPQFLAELREFTVENVLLLRDGEGQTQAGPGLVPGGQPDPFVAFRVNVFVDNTGAEGPPIVLESNPSWTNLFGRIERRAYLGTYISDHTLLRPGSVHRANGGYLVLNLLDVLTKPGSWDGVKRLIR